MTNEVKTTDLNFIPASFGDISKPVKAYNKLISWFVQQYDKGVGVASFFIISFGVSGSFRKSTL
ncbi:MAG: hypothetical protein MUO72_04280 [Bacteroidales bacterium]|nr:hypothetical protein [Bacteroidales bacterium]